MNSWAKSLPVAKSKADLAYESLHRAIAGGDLKPGERVNMDELSRALGVSKIPIREAVKRLEADGLLVTRPHAGPVVAGVDAAEMRGVFLAREAIETLVAELAAARITEEQLAELAEVHAGMRAALAAGGTEQLAELNSRFHRVLAEAAGYRVLAELTDQLLLTVRRYRVAAPLDTASWETVAAEHEALLTAVRSRDPRAAADAARRHMRSQAAQEPAA
ncbi:GntR family transcriptional regulator [Kitasatospora cineracea]|uniref:DNA-binding GntR family transcriptional regulator n=1 Tax=Kitasatospora cineracea TaxID=88074 RepID=A0A8G1ULX8_9ACTN|nr:GntR family transcriptional regulator [Kitasatospora cineracea]ROR46422.1 DNA-binding GntR family transcriptional regulator [Kitasatospora cineracea]